MRTHVDLCTGIGGFSLGFIAAKLSEPVLLCDFDEKVRKLLRVRFPGIPIANDVKEIASDPKRFIRQRPFILSSGYPCQPFSASGKREGEQDPRHIFPHIAEIVAQTRPSYCVFENVYGHISLGLDKVLSQMGSLDYATATFIVPAAGFRPHKRDRLWIICKNMANTDNQGIWSCKRRSDVDNEGFGGERGANRERSSSHDEWNDTQTTKDERMVVANTSGIRGQNVSGNDKETAKRSSENENVKPSNSCTSDRGSDVSNTNSNGSSATKERGSSEETIHEEQTRQIGTLDIEGTSDLSQATRDVANSNDTRNRTSEHGVERERSENIAKGQGESQSESSRQSAVVADSAVSRLQEHGHSKSKNVVQRSENVANASSERLQGGVYRGEIQRRETIQHDIGHESTVCGQPKERADTETFASFCRIFDGISDWLDEPRHIQRTTHKNEHRAERLKQLGNALLPQITYRIGLAIKEIEDKNETT